MLDKHGRVVIGTELLLRCDSIKVGKIINVFYDSNTRTILIMPESVQPENGMYFVNSVTLNEKGRMSVPVSIRNAFPNATYLPAEKDGKIYILIIDHEKKPE